MKRLIAILLIPMLTGIIALAQTDEEEDFCTYKEFRDRVKEMLDPYEYDAQKVSKFTLKDKSQTKEIEVPLFIGENYRVVFSQEGMPQPVLIEIYNKASTKSKRELLWSNEDSMDHVEWTWEPEKSKKFYVNYTVPATNDVTKKGCMYFVVGYESKFKKDD